MNHLERESDVHDHAGAEYDLIVFDELCQFTATQFWFLLSRNRSTSGVRPYVRGTCNPDPQSFVKKLIAWWLDDEGRFAREDRAGVIRYFIRGDDDELIWGDTPEDVYNQAPELFDLTNPELTPEQLCLSFTFVPAMLDDNPALKREDPKYRAKLRNMGRVQRARLEKGDWSVRETAGEVFREEWFPIVDKTPDDVVARLRYWDLAGSKRRRSNHTAGLLFAMHADGTYTVEDVVNEKRRPQGTEDLLTEVAKRDGIEIEIHIEQDVSSGELLIDQYQRHALRGHTIHGHRVRGQGTKEERAQPVSSAAEKGHIRLRRGEWNRAFLAQLQDFPDGGADDMVDALSGAFAQIQHGEIAIATARTR
jgi:predicted phage terminase large subunit-like protein